MKVTIDTKARTLRPDDGAAEMDLYAPESFAVLSELWVKVGWALKHSYGFSWFGRPVIQLPEDMIRVQEVLYRVQPDVVIETGIAHGGSLVYYASLLKAMGRGRVVGVDIEIRPPNRAAIEAHPLSSLITLIEGDSAAPATVAAVRGRLQAGERALVILDSNHTRPHVLRELEAYAPLVSVGSYLVVTDGIMGALHDVPGGHPEWQHDNPSAAAEEFLARHPEFSLDEPRPMLEAARTAPVTYWPKAYLRRNA
jgi:cephalosporin hydroxylase